MIVTKYMEQPTLVTESDEWKAKCEELGLSQQAALMENKESPIPFKLMTTREEQIIKVVCQTHCDVREYDLAPIPLEVLELYSLSIKEGYFKQVEVWYDKHGTDPFMVGITDKPESKGNKYLIAKWCDQDMSWHDLEIMAQKKWCATRKANMQEALEAAQRTMKDGGLADWERFLNGDWVRSW